MSNRKVGILSAMPEEIAGVEALLEQVAVETIGVHEYYSGRINLTEVVLVFSGWGKVATAATVSTLIHRFGVTEIVFTGVAGGLKPGVQIGDIVLAKSLVQHDLDARPIFARFEIPLLKKTFIDADAGLVSKLSAVILDLLSSNAFKDVIGEKNIANFNLTDPKLLVADIASGDQFINNSIQRQSISAALPSVVCVEMEGAAVAQVCYENKIPFAVIRTISDVADENAHVDFLSFVQLVSSKYSIEIIRRYFI